jgi:hypothetical protein
LGFALFLAVAARADKVTSDYDHSVDFSKYKTFMWIREPQPPNPLMKDRIMGSVNDELTARGMRQVDEGADLGVGANLATEERHTWETYYTDSGWGWDWGGAGWSTTEMRTYDVGTLSVELFDSETHKLIWQGVGVDEVASKPAKQTRENDKQIEKMFKHYPGFAR